MAGRSSAAFTRTPLVPRTRRHACRADARQSRRAHPQPHARNRARGTMVITVDRQTRDNPRGDTADRRLSCPARTPGGDTEYLADPRPEEHREGEKGGNKG